MKLIDRCRSFWKLWSIWFHTASTTLIGLLLMVPAMPAEIQALIPATYRAIAIGLWLMGGIAARLIKQKAAAKP